MVEKKYETELERKIFELILSFPERIDVMETRNEESSRLLARRIYHLVRSEMREKD
ncbi:MAG: hypothetical protein ACRD3V_17135 [Vicinamibacteria bacterium]